MTDECLPHTLLHDTEGLGKKSNDVAGGLGGGVGHDGAYTQHHNTDGLGKIWNDVRGDQ